ncbi:MAG: non-homologous end-joining DNA ligase [Saprospiraceae bacterium]|nr:non-homologous end-joining DNA ligase [Saprospiraceae bacterium]
MAKYKLIQLGKHKIKLSNLDKVLFPDVGVIKAEVIQYYLQMAPIILRHIKHRPLTFIRYPDGVYGESFFQKNKPDWTPQWIQSVRIGTEKKINYVVATNEATLVFLANLACIEFHQSSVQHPTLETPDHFVFDLDPPESMSFEEIKSIAVSLRDYLVNYGYHPFVKTSGKKGLHIFVPIHRKWDYPTLKQTLKQITDGFVKQHPKRTTANISKAARVDKLFLDTVRNNRSQTVTSPYSLRATPKCTVSMPLTWEELDNTKGPEDYTIANVWQKMQADGDAWEGFGAHAAPLHDQVKRKHTASTSKALKAYMDKRDFHQTPEPAPSEDAEFVDDAFVIHRHDARNLHYDLRLSEDGVLRSWAVPRGLPGAPGVMRLAVETEPHPMEYLDWEGTIPKGQYGAGDMWVFARGNYRITKTKKNGFYFKLESETIDNEFRIHQTKGKDWLLERVDPAEFVAHETIIPHMHAGIATRVPDELDYIYEVKWDGIRTMIYIDDEDMTIRSRSQRDLSRQFPELAAERKSLKCAQAVLDGEIVVLNDKGMPQFKTTVGRIHKTGEHSIAMAAKSQPAYCYLFDVIYLDGCYVNKEPLWKRKEWLKSLIKPGGQFRYSEEVADGDALFEASGKMGLEGIMAKKRDSIYQIGKRSNAWLKIKHRSTATCRIIGYTEGQGDRAAYFGALHLTDADHENHVYLGKVGTGFNMAALKRLSKQVKAVPETDKPIEQKLEDDAQSTWIEPILVCEVEYASITPNGTLREPVFVRLRPDLDP